jgi:hypothetical protein
MNNHTPSDRAYTKENMAEADKDTLRVLIGQRRAQNVTPRKRSLQKTSVDDTHPSISHPN